MTKLITVLIMVLIVQILTACGAVEMNRREEATMDESDRITARPTGPESEQIASLLTKINKLENSIDQLIIINDKLVSLVESLESDANVDAIKIEELEATIAKNEAAIDELKAQLVDANEELRDAKRSASKEEKARIEAEETISKAKAKIDRIQSKLDAKLNK